MVWVKEIIDKYEIFITENTRKVDSLGFKIIEIDLFESDEIARTLQKYEIEVVVNAIGLTNVEKCQFDPNKAANLIFHSWQVAKACSISGIKLIHISTDHFFNDEEKMHTEEDHVSLINTMLNQNLLRNSSFIALS